MQWFWKWSGQKQKGPSTGKRGAVSGRVEEQHGFWVRGWCVAARERGATVPLQVIADGQHIDWPVAREERDDVAQALGLAGDCAAPGFAAPLPTGLWQTAVVRDGARARGLSVQADGQAIEGVGLRCNTALLQEEFQFLVGDHGAALDAVAYHQRFLAWWQHANAAKAAGITPDWLNAALLDAERRLALDTRTPSWLMAITSPEATEALAVLVWGGQLGRRKAKEGQGLPLAYALMGWLCSDGFEMLVLSRLRSQSGVPADGLSKEEEALVAQHWSQPLAAMAGARPMVLLSALLTQPGPARWLAVAHGARWLEAQPILAQRARAAGRRLLGHLELVTRELIHGWLMDANAPGETLQAEVRWNGRVVAAGPARGYRPDVQGRYGGSSDVGLRLPWTPDSVPRDQMLDFTLHESSSGLQIGPALRFSNSLAEQKQLSQMLSFEIQELKTKVDALAALMPDALTHTAFSVDQYHYYRQTRQVPAPPKRTGIPQDAQRRFACLLSAESDAPDAIAIRRTVDALREQTVPFHQLVVVGDHPDVSELVQQLGLSDARITQAADWVAAQAMLSALGPEDWVILLETGDHLDAEALAWVAHEAPQAGSLIYWDEDWRQEGPIHPFFDPAVSYSRPILRRAFDADAMLELNGVGLSFACRATHLHQACDLLMRDGPQPTPTTLGKPHGAHSAHPLALTAREALVWALHHQQSKTEPQAVFRHIEHTLLTWVTAQGAEDARLASLIAHCEPNALSPWLPTAMQGHTWRRAKDALTDSPKPLVEWAEPQPPQGLSVVIPTRDGVNLLSRCVESLRTMATHAERLEILVADNGSTEPETLAYLAEREAKGWLRAIRMDEPFNWSRLNNRLAAAARHDHLLFLNNDTLMLTRGWDATLMGLLQREDVGAVGARLLYGDMTLQHAGVVMTRNGSADNDGNQRPVNDAAAIFDTQLTRQVPAVTGAFLATTRRVWERVGGFEEVMLPVSFNDVDWCLRAGREGLACIYAPALSMIHFESKTRGNEWLHEAKRNRSMYEIKALRRRT